MRIPRTGNFALINPHDASWEVSISDGNWNGFDSDTSDVYAMIPTAVPDVGYFALSVLHRQYSKSLASHSRIAFGKFLRYKKNAARDVETRYLSVHCSLNVVATTGVVPSLIIGVRDGSLTAHGQGGTGTKLKNQLDSYTSYPGTISTEWSTSGGAITSFNVKETFVVGDFMTNDSYRFKVSDYMFVGFDLQNQYSSGKTILHFNAVVSAWLFGTEEDAFVVDDPTIA